LLFVSLCVCNHRFLQFIELTWHAFRWSISLQLEHCDHLEIMANTVVGKFRTAFSFNGIVNWFPGHMAKTTRLMRENMKNIDIVVEVRDARVS
jgi:hypothetical protein